MRKLCAFFRFIFLILFIFFPWKNSHKKSISIKNKCVYISYIHINNKSVLCLTDLFHIHVCHADRNTPTGPEWEQQHIIIPCYSIYIFFLRILHLISVKVNIYLYIFVFVYWAWPYIVYWEYCIVLLDRIFLQLAPACAELCKHFCKMRYSVFFEFNKYVKEYCGMLTRSSPRHHHNNKQQQE